MLEDQTEERACLHALGLLDEAGERAFAAEFAENESVRRTVSELEETLANLSLSTTPIRLPGDEFRRRLFERIASEPARVTTDRHGFTQTINPAFTLLCGYRLEDLRGRKPGQLLQGSDSEPEAIDALRRAVREGYACAVTMVNYHRDGSPYRVKIEIDPIRNGENVLTGFAATERQIVEPIA